jgi:hypothetical protein
LLVRRSNRSRKLADAQFRASSDVPPLAMKNPEFRHRGRYATGVPLQLVSRF